MCQRAAVTLNEGLSSVRRLALQGPARARQIWGAAPQTEPDLTIPMELTCSAPVFESPTATKARDPLLSASAGKASASRARGPPLRRR